MSEEVASANTGDAKPGNTEVSSASRSGDAVDESRESDQIPGRLANEQARESFSLLVVDDSRFSSTITAKILSASGYNDVRFTNSPLQALRSLEKRPADVVIADWNLASMNGLELTRRIRTTEPADKHRTQVMLLTSNEDSADFEDALSVGADDFLNKSHIRSLLQQRVMTMQKLCERQNSLLKENASLNRQISDLRTNDIIDPVTGLGNLKFTLASVGDLTNEIGARGGAACLLLVGLSNLSVIREQYDPETLDELITGFATKVRNLVRPLDVVTQPEPGILAVSMRQTSLSDCSSHSFKRVFDNLYMHSFKTEEGYIPVVVGVSICVADESTGLPEPRDYLRAGYDALMRSYDTGVVTLTNYSKEQADRHLVLWA